MIWVPCSMFPLVNKSNGRESDIVVSASCDDLKQQEEFRLKVEIEAVERKLEETLEYQRQMENEAKQKHLEEQQKRAGEMVLDSMTEGSHTDLKPIAYPDQLKQLRHNMQDCFLSDDHPSDWKDGIMHSGRSQAGVLLECDSSKSLQVGVLCVDIFRILVDWVEEVWYLH